MGISVSVAPSTQYASPGGVANVATILGRATNNMGPKVRQAVRQSFYAKRDIIARAPVSVSNRFQAIEDTTAEEVESVKDESVKDRELPVTGKAVKGQKLPLKGTPPVIGKKTLEEGQGRWSTPVSAAFAELKWKYQVPEFERFDNNGKSESQKNQRATSYKTKQRFNRRFLVTCLLRILGLALSLIQHVAQVRIL